MPSRIQEMNNIGSGSSPLPGSALGLITLASLILISYHSRLLYTHSWGYFPEVI